MHGFLGSRRRWLVLAGLGLTIIVLSAGVLTACTKMVPQDRATGEDGKQKGAKVLELENDEVITRGVVTYPGGDRVDWKVVELPADNRGNLDVKLTWVPPRARLRLGVDVFDEWGKLVKSFQGKRRSAKYKAAGTIEDAKGKLFVRVYAVDRGDAGAYKLTLTYSPTVVFDPKLIVMPEPPKLPGVPSPAQPCDPLSFDRKNPACASVCPQPMDPSWPACMGKCPTPPDVNNPSCHATMACPNPPDRRIKACPKSAWPKCDLARKDPQNPNCDDARADPVRGKVVNVQEQSDGVIVTINRGSNQGVEKGWAGRLLRADGRSLDGGGFVVTSVSKDKCYGKVKLKTDTVNANKDTELAPP